MVSGEELPVNTSTAVDVIAGDIDLLSEILIRLPAKPLLRFKSVSKRWLSLISSPHFCRRHVRRNPNAVSGLFLHGLPGSEYHKVGFLSLNRNPSVAAAAAHFKSADINFTGNSGIRIRQSCNGLLIGFTASSLESKINWYIVNPATRQYSILPPLTDNIAKKSMFHGSIHLAFDPLKSPYCKAVCARRVGDNSQYCQMAIYSNESGIWRNSGDPFIVPYGMALGNAVFSNGALHWICPRDDFQMYFNVEEERVGTMPPLPFTVDWGGNRRFRYFGESFGHLHLLEIVGSRTTQFKVFELEKDYSKWFLKFNVDLDPIVNAHPGMIRPFLDPGVSYCAFNILSIVREEDDDESSLLLHIPGEIISYKFKDKSFRKLHDFAPSSRNNGGVRQFGCINALQYIETLACVHSCT